MTRLPLWIGFVLLAAAGCGSDTKTVRVWGDASYDGRPIESGQIVLSPIEDTRGPSTGGAIDRGKYDVRKQDGPRAGGVYRVEITAFDTERSYTPNASGRGPITTIREQFLPAKYNRESQLRLEVAPLGDENRHDFDLTK
jgi:hypothetical protein